ncbi:glycosyltransferase family 4 protein [Cronobacter dublinensis]
MRVLHVTNRLSEGGVETFLLNLLPALRKQNIEADLLVLDNKEILMAEQFRKEGVKVFSSPHDGLRNIKHIKYLMEMSSEYDVIHSHLFPSQYYVAIAGCLKKKKLITTEHCNFNKRRKLPFKPIEYIAYSFYNKIIGVSKAAAANLIRWLPLLNYKIVTISNGINIKPFENIRAISREELKVPEGAFLIVMTARFFKQKDHITLIRALPYLPDNVEVIFIGSGDTMDDSILEAQKLQVAQRCHFLGRRGDVPEIIKAADLCVLSTHYEGLPVSVIEYMASAKAVIATNVDGLNEMIESTCLSKPNDAEDLAEKIKLILCDKNYKHLMETRNHAKSADFSLDQMVSSYISLYRSLS